MATLPRVGQVQPIEGVAGGVAVPVTLMAGGGPTGAFDSGNLDETLVVDLFRASMTARDQSQAAMSQNVPVEARTPSNYDALVGNTTLEALNTLGNLFVNDQATGLWSKVTGQLGNAISGVTTSGVRAAYAAAISVGSDTSGAGVLKAVEARTYSVWDGANGSQNILGTMAAAFGKDGATGSLSLIHADFPANMSGRGTAAVRALYSAAVCEGTDNTGAGVLRPLEARSYANFNGATIASLIGLDCHSILFGRLSAGATINVIDVDQPATVGGLATNLRVAMYANAILNGTDTTGAAVMRSLENRAVSGYSTAATSLLGLLTGSYLLARFESGATIRAVDCALPADVGGTGTGGINALYTSAIIAGTDTTGANVFRPVEARSFSGFDNVAGSLIGLAVQAVAYGTDQATSTLRLIGADLATNISGRTASGVRGLYADAIATGIDNTGAAVLRPVEARSDNNFANTNGSLIGLHTLASVFLMDVVSSTSKFGSAVSETGTGNLVLQGVLEGRQNGYWSSFRSRRFAVTHNSESGSITAQATYVATTPTLLLSNNAAAVRAIIRSLYIAVTSASVNPVRVVLKLDSANRLSVAGTALTPQNENSGGGASAITAFNENPTATAEGGGTKREYIFFLPSGKAASITIGLNDSFIVGLTGSFLAYVVDDAGLAAPSILFNLDYEEAA